MNYMTTKEITDQIEIIKVEANDTTINQILGILHILADEIAYLKQMINDLNPD